MQRKENQQSPQIQEAEATSSKAAKAELARDYDQAFQLYVKAAESFLHLSRSTSHPEKLKQQWKANAAKALERAERIKKFVERKQGSSSGGNASTSSHQFPAPETRLTPVGINHFSPQEQFYVLKKGSVVDGLLFPLWDDPTSFSSIDGTYSDSDGQPKLSPEQLKVSSVWRRPNTESPQSHPVDFHRKILPQEILQHIVTDCSVCASISVCLEHSRRFGSSLAESSVIATDAVSGRYDIRVLFNGSWRRIVIDDKLPFDPHNGTLMCMSILMSDDTPLPPHILWPSLLEKAYMKLMGGYDFPGSNSSIDLHAFAGWIPEHIETKRSNFEREKTWERVETGFASGQCLVTLGTGPSSPTCWRDIQLLPSHSYAVIDAYEGDGGRFLTVLDSWVRSSGEGQEPSRVLHIPWSEVLNAFDGVYLSWDPRMWAHSLTFHGIWKRNEKDDEGTRHLQVQFSTESTIDEEIWVLLSRHVADTRRTSDFVSLRVDIEDVMASSRPSLTHLENHHSLSSKAIYTNSIHVLVRTRVPSSQRAGQLSILSSYDGQGREVGFTLTVYARSNMNISWVKSTHAPPYTMKVEGTLTSKNAGGNCKYPTFMDNPQYHLVIHPPKTKLGSNIGKAKVNFTLKASKDLPVNVAVTRSQGQRVSELPEKDVVTSSGAYSYGLAHVSDDLSIGEYTVIASAFEPHHMGQFSLKVDSSYPFDFKPIPQEGAGMYCNIMRGAWEGKTAAGAPSFNRYFQNPVFELEVPALSKLKIRLQLIQPSTIALNLTIYPSSLRGTGDALNKIQHIATTGAYDDSISGVATPQITIGSGKYYLVPSTFNPGLEVAFRLILYSSAAGLKVVPVDFGEI